LKVIAVYVAENSRISESISTLVCSGTPVHSFRDWLSCTTGPECTPCPSNAFRPGSLDPRQAESQLLGTAMDPSFLVGGWPYSCSCQQW